MCQNKIQCKMLITAKNVNKEYCEFENYWKHCYIVNKILQIFLIFGFDIKCIIIFLLSEGGKNSFCSDWFATIQNRVSCFARHIVAKKHAHRRRRLINESFDKENKSSRKKVNCNLLAAK